MTVHRDLHQEDEPLPLTLLDGHIVMVYRPIPSMPVVQDIPRNHRDDLPIAILAAEMVDENDLIFFDNGQEIPPVISMIPDAITFAGICYSHRVLAALNRKPNVTAILCDGTYRAKSDTFYDASSSSPLDSLDPRKVFISTSGVYYHFDVSWLNPENLTTKRRAMARGLRKILLARHTLFGGIASASPVPLSISDVLISRRPSLADYITHYRNASVKVTTPDSEDEWLTEKAPYSC